MRSFFCCIEKKEQNDINVLNGSMLLQNNSISSSYHEQINEQLMKENNIGPYQKCYRNKNARKYWHDSLQDETNINRSDSKSTQADLRQTPCLSKQSSRQESNIKSQQITEAKAKYSFLSSNNDYNLLKLTQNKNENIEFRLEQLFIQKQKIIRKQVIYGPPSAYRWSCWKLLLLENSLSFQGIGFYEKHLTEDPVDKKNISKDIDRTLIDHPFFCQEDSRFAQSLLGRILSAIAQTLPSLGYCQGMNYLAGLLLIVSGSDESLSYSTVLSLFLSPKHLLYFLYCENMPLHHFFCCLIHNKVDTYFPDLAANITKSKIPDSFWLTKMIMTLFIYNFKIEDSVRAWDYIIVRGALRAIPELLLGFLNTQENQLKNIEFERFGEIFAQGDFIKVDMAIVIYESQKYLIDRKEVEQIGKQFLKENKYQELSTLLQYYGNSKKYEKEVQKFVKRKIK